MPIQAYDIGSARLILEEKEIDLIILDINLPDGNGLEYLKEIKEKYPCPVIMLTANDLETDIVLGLEMGANDYITKPFSLAVLRARVNTQLRQKRSQNKFVENEFVFDFENQEFFKHNISIKLSKTEQKLLKILVENKGRTLERTMLLERVWTEDIDYVDENALSVTIKRLRDKLEDTTSKAQVIKTIYGIGYAWAVKR